MKRFLFAILLACLTATASHAVPALSKPAKVTQPDGSSLTVTLHGDEYLHFNTTTDGYTVVTDHRGYYVYAQKADGELRPTAQVAHDAHLRTAAETAWLRGRAKFIAPDMQGHRAAEQQAELSRQARTRQQRRAAEYDYDAFRGLIILVQFNDRKFSRMTQQMVDNMVNKQNYTGYDRTTYGQYTGSVSDYFADQSQGLFKPHFDVVGPVTIDYSQYDANATDNAFQLTAAALEAADELVDYSLYDTDDDGWVDMVYFIFAGLGSNISGNDSRLLWPHAGAIYNWAHNEWVTHDDVWFYRYACSTELYGSSGWAIPDGIGTICHEFSHVLGLPDLYDTDYERNGQSAHPAEWSVMAGGSYQNNGRTPVGYNLYERYAVGFTTPTLIEGTGELELLPLGSSNEGYRLNTNTEKEYFLIENRQLSDKWDRYLPGHGMLVFHVDSTNSRAWDNNQVNSNAKHNYFTLLRAAGGTANDASNSFPGTANVTELNNVGTNANLLSWQGEESPWGFDNISEKNGVVTASVIDVNVLRQIEIAGEKNMANGTAVKLHPLLTPLFAPCLLAWSSSNPEVATVDSEGTVTALSEGTTTIKVVANADPLLTSECTLTVTPMPVAQAMAQFKESADVPTALRLADAQVLMNYEGALYLRDSSGAIVVPTDVANLPIGTTVNGYLYGLPVNNDRLTWLSAADGYSTADFEVDETPASALPIELTLAELSARHYADLLKINTVLLQTLNEPVQGLYAVSGSRRLRLYNNFKISNISVPKNLNKTFSVTGILLTRQTDNGLIDELALTQAPLATGPVTDGVDDVFAMQAEGQAEVFTAGGLLVARTDAANADLLPLKPGLYIVKWQGGSRKMLRR